MADEKHVMTAEEAKQFQTYSVGNVVTIKTALACGCEPYQDVFTYRRWQAQGMQVQRGEKAIKIPVVKTATTKVDDPVTGENHTIARKFIGGAAVFCRCQVKPRGEK